MMRHIIMAGAAALFFTGPAEAADRLASGNDSWAALGILLVAGLVSLGLSVRPGWLRRTTLLLGALASMAGAAMLVRVESAGTFSTFKPPLTPLDPYKGIMLNLDLVAAIGIAIVLIVAALQRGPGTPMPLSMTNMPNHYGGISRLLHWSIATLILLLFPIGILMSGLPETSFIREPLHIIHKSLGLVVLLLAIVRIAWGRISRVPVLSPELNPANRIAAKTAHILLYILMLGFPISGYLMSAYYGKIAPFFFIDLPVLVHQDRQAMLPFGGLHKMLLPLLFYAVIAAHIAGALKHRFLDGQKDALERMTG